MSEKTAQGMEVKLHNRRVRVYPVEYVHEGQSYFIEFEHFDKNAERADFDIVAGGAHSYTKRKSRVVRIKVSEQALFALGAIIEEMTE